MVVERVSKNWHTSAVGLLVLKAEIKLKLVHYYTSDFVIDPDVSRMNGHWWEGKVKLNYLCALHNPENKMCFHKLSCSLQSTVLCGLRAFSCTQLAFWLYITEKRSLQRSKTVQLEGSIFTHTQKLFTEQKVSVNIPLIGLMKTQAEHNHKLYHNKPLNMDYGGTTLRFSLSLCLSGV